MVTQQKILIVSAPLYRKLAALFYDGILLFALLLLASSIAMIFNHGKTFGAHNYFFTTYLLFVVGCFYIWFWTHGGKTLGMQAWRIQVVDNELQPLSGRQAIYRFLYAIPSVSLFGIGYLLCLLRPDKLSLHDWLSHTRVILIKKPQPK